MPTSRRQILTLGAAAGIEAFATRASALAHAPQAGKQAQLGFYRFKLGAIEITVISDGTLAFPAETLWGDRAEDARGLLNPRSTRLARSGCKSTPFSSTPATRWC